MLSKLLILLLLIPISTPSAFGPKDFSVRIKGQFLCHEEPYKNLPFDIYYQDVIFKGNYSQRFTDNDGKFDYSCYVKGAKEFVVQPYIVIQHTCWEHKVVPHKCNRKVLWPIPIRNLTVGSMHPWENKTFNAGIVDLRFKIPNDPRGIQEVVARC